MHTGIEAEKPFLDSEFAPIAREEGRSIKAAKIRLVKAVADLDELGVDVQQIDLNEVLEFARAFLR